MVSQLEAAYPRLDSSTPVWVQAWGGRGAKGASSGGTAGAFGGYAGYAMTIFSVGSLTGKQLYLYIGASGSEHANYSGQGGASTIVGTQAISQMNLNDLTSGRLLVVAGGSGGGGQSSGGSSSGRGGAGGVVFPGSLGGDGGSGTGPDPGKGPPTAPVAQAVEVPRIPA